MLRKLILLALMGLALQWLHGCATSQQQGQGQQAQGQGSQNEMMEEEGGEGDNEDFNDQAANDPTDDYTQGEAVNNAVENEFTAEETPVDDGTLTDPLSEGAAAPETEAAAGLLDPVMSNPAAAAGAVPAADPASTGVMSAGGNVMYAPGMIYGYGSTAGSSTPTCSLEKGDHPLLRKQAEWGQIRDNQFVRLTDMSEPAVARDRAPAPWN